MDGPDALARHIESLAPPTIHVKRDVEGYALPDAPMVLVDLECPVCYDILDRPVELACGKLACATCCVQWVLGSPGVSCPGCLDMTPLDRSSFRPPPTVILKLLSAMVLFCGRCGRKVKAADHKEHLESECKSCTLQQSESHPQIPAEMTLETVLSQPLNVPPLETEIKVASNIIRRSLNLSKDKQFCVPTRGKV